MSQNIYRSKWDEYAKSANREGGRWPGDEWGIPQNWARDFDAMFVNFGAASWRRVVEIGAGAGKYSVMLLEKSEAEILSADISPEYQKICRERIEECGYSDRVSFKVLDEDPKTLYRSIVGAGWDGSIDALFSMDAMVHVDLQYLVLYLVTAAKTLRRDGKLVMTLANSCSEAGFKKLIDDIPAIFPRQGQPSAKFEWLSPQSVTDLLARLGFEIELLGTNERDIKVVASKVREPEAWITACLGG